MNDQKPDFDLFKGYVSGDCYTMTGDDDVKDYKFEYEKRYFKIIISSGSAFPRNPQVINIKTKVSEPNPRKADQIEPDVCYALIDFDTYYYVDK